jgi:hypothetical protein
MLLSLLKNEKLLGLRPGGTTGEKGRILYEKVSEWNVFMFIAPKVVAVESVD